MSNDNENNNNNCSINESTEENYLFDKVQTLDHVISHPLCTERLRQCIIAFQQGRHILFSHYNNQDGDTCTHPDQSSKDPLIFVFLNLKQPLSTHTIGSIILHTCLTQLQIRLAKYVE